MGGRCGAAAQNWRLPHPGTHTHMSLSCSTVLTLVAGFARPTAPGTRPLLYVDPVDEDLTREAISRGVPLLPVWSAPSRRVPRSAQRVPDKALQQLGSIPVAPKNGEEVAWASSRLPAGTCLGGVLCGSEAGLSTAERMQAALVPERSNGVCPARRDKLLMNRALAGHGLLTAATASPSDWRPPPAAIHPPDSSKLQCRPLPPLYPASGPPPRPSSARFAATESCSSRGEARAAAASR